MMLSLYLGIGKRRNEPIQWVTIILFRRLRGMENKESKLYKVTDCVAQSGHLILMVVAFDVIITSILLLLHFSISSLNIMMGFATAVIIYMHMYREDDGINRKSVIIVTCSIIIVSIMINYLIQEISYDGNWYHKLATGCLKMGWNPVYENINDYISALGIPADRIRGADIWAGCYTKASWYFDATIYALTNSIEAAKIFNILIFISVFGVCYDYLRVKINKMHALMLGLILTGIPVSYAQLFTYYLDGALGQLLFASVIILMSISDEQYNHTLKKRRLFYLALCIILCSNLKFTGLVYEAAFCGVFFIYWCVKKRAVIVKLIAYYIFVVSMTVLIVGAGTYVANAINYDNPVYPIGSEFFVAPAALHSLESVGLEDASSLRQLMTMLFVRVSGMSDNKNPVLEWKIPFTFRPIEFIKCTNDNVRGGGGVFYSGILCVSIVLFIFMFYKLRKTRRTELTVVVIIVAVSALLMTIMPAGGAARYSPYIYFLPYFTMFLLLLYIRDNAGSSYGNNYRNRINEKLVSFVTYSLACIMLINSIAFSEYILRGIVLSYIYEQEYKEMKSTNNVKIDTEKVGMVFNFMDRGVNYEFATEDIIPDGEMVYVGLKYEIVDKVND